MSTKSSTSSNSPSPGRTSEEMQRQDTNGSAKDGSSSLKRVREGSLEPTQASIPDPVATKKNRIGSSSKTPSGPNDIPEAEDEDVPSPTEDAEGASESPVKGSIRREERPVGEVRKQVEKMSYEELQQSNPPEVVNNGEGAKDIEIEAVEGDQGEGDDSWEKIEKDETDSSNGDNLKRKALNRSESSFAQEGDDISIKRVKDISEVSAEEAKSKPVPPAKKPQSTFSSFASSASPFAALSKPSPTAESTSSASDPASSPAPVKKPQATFGSFAGKSSPFASTASPAPAPVKTASPPVTSPEPATTSASAPAKKPQATFGAFSSSSSSPFASSKPASTFGSAPVKGSAFGTYSSTSSAFSSKKTTPSEGETKSEAGPSNFGDILKQTGGDETTAEKKEMQEQDVTTGEEEESTVFQTRAKLYTNDSNNGWKERGIGLLKLNVRRSDGSGARLVMRADGVLRLILNAKLYKGITTYPDGKMLRMTLPEDGKMTIVCFRMSNPKIVEDLMEHIQEHQPTTGEPDLHANPV